MVPLHRRVREETRVQLCSLTCSLTHMTGAYWSIICACLLLILWNDSDFQSEGQTCFVADWTDKWPSWYTIPKGPKKHTVSCQTMVSCVCLKAKQGKELLGILLLGIDFVDILDDAIGSYLPVSIYYWSYSDSWDDLCNSMHSPRIV